MFKVLFGGTVIFSASQVEPAIAFALELHRISNVSHVITVVDNLDKDVVSLMSEQK